MALNWLLMSSFSLLGGCSSISDVPGLIIPLIALEVYTMKLGRSVVMSWSIDVSLSGVWIARARLMVHGVISVFLICGIWWVGFLLSAFSFVFRNDNDIFAYLPTGNLALCRFHSNHVALRKQFTLVSSFHPNPFLSSSHRNQGHRGRRVRNQIQCFDLNNWIFWPFNGIDLIVERGNRPNQFVQNLLISDIWWALVDCMVPRSPM